MLLEIDETTWKPFIHKDGHIYIKVIKALYGHPKAPILWYNYCKNKLAKIGFKPLLCEQCIFIRYNDDGTFDLLGLHVDDTLMGSLRKSFFQEMQDFLNNEYDGEGTITVGANLEYLNINLKFNKDDQSCYIQEHYWQKVINKFNILECEKCPHKRDLWKN